VERQPNQRFFGRWSTCPPIERSRRGRCGGRSWDGLGSKADPKGSRLVRFRVEERVFAVTAWGRIWCTAVRWSVAKLRIYYDPRTPSRVGRITSLPAPNCALTSSGPRDAADRCAARRLGVSTVQPWRRYHADDLPARTAAILGCPTSRDDASIRPARVTWRRILALLSTCDGAAHS